MQKVALQKGNINYLQSFTFCVMACKVYLVYNLLLLTLFGQYSLNIFNCVTQKYDSKSSVSAARGCSS